MSPAANFYGKRKPVSAENTPKTRKLPRTAFKPGQSGNPNGRPKGTLNRVTIEARQFWERMIDDPEYQEILAGRLKRGELAPAMETMGWYYARGKPKETVELSVISQERLRELTPEELAALEQQSLGAETALAKLGQFPPKG